jgi:predicted aspartyl protease
LRRVTIDFEVANNEDVVLARVGAISPDKVRRLSVRGVVDSGAARFVLPERIVKRLGLTISEHVKVLGADGRNRRSLALGAQLTILGRKGTYSAVVEANRKTALIGAMVMADLDLLIDCVGNRVVPRDPRFITTEIE